MIDTNSAFWRYLSGPQRSLIEHGQFLLKDVKNHPQQQTYDYSYVVFPVAKAYEGFLKQLFLDMGFITKQQYNSDHFRIGRVLSPNLQRRLGKNSVYNQICTKQQNCELAEALWQAWKRGRNRIFHYFPHNIQALTLAEAENIVEELLTTMERAYHEVQPTGKHRDEEVQFIGSAHR